MMRLKQYSKLFARVFCAFFILSVVLASSAAASAPDYPRRVAVAPFASLAKEDIGTTIAVLPRLISSRLMALAGADVLLLNAGGKSAADAAKEARYPLLLEGTVAKLGKGYSIDVVVTDLAKGEKAGAFFAAAANEDEIISQIGMLSGDIAEKVFGVQGAVRAASPPPGYVAVAPVAAAPVPDPFAAAPPTGVAVTTGVAESGQHAAASAPPPSPSAPGGSTLASGWVPSSVKRIAQSGRVADELNGIVTVQAEDGEGNALVAAYGKTNIYFHRIKGEEVLPYTTIRRPLGEHILSADVFDIDGDGENEVLVTSLAEESIQSFILKKKGDIYEEIAGKIRYYLVVLPDWKGKPAMAGQYQGVDTPFKGKIVILKWDGKQLVPGEELPHSTTIVPLLSGALGLSSGRFGNEWRLIYTDTDSHLRVLDDGGKSIYKSRSQHGSRLDFFEWGPYIHADGRRKWYPIRTPARLAPGSGETPLVMVTETKKGLLDLVGGSYESTRLVLLQWEVGEFLEKAGTQGSSQFLSGADFLSRSDFGKGSRVIVSVIEQTGAFFNEQASRVLLYKVD